MTKVCKKFNMHSLVAESAIVVDFLSLLDYKNLPRVPGGCPGCCGRVVCLSRGVGGWCGGVGRRPGASAKLRGGHSTGD